ncbi:hypothetical protein [Amycolatopsis sp. cmx-4-68]|uniref:hypothetical protein n=1 Tax=Amycolatopsis sp. cmx-4-68 TaxID=2790938 RepID=UPI00397A0607
MLAVIALSFLASAGAQTDLSPPGRLLVLAAAAIALAVAITGKVTEAYAARLSPLPGWDPSRCRSARSRWGTLTLRAPDSSVVRTDAGQFLPRRR